MIWVTLVILLLLYLPFRISRGFPAVCRITFALIVAVKVVVMVIVHYSLISETGLPIVMDASVDAKKYYDFGKAFEFEPIWNIQYGELVDERGGRSHLGYPVLNILAFKLAPSDPMLLLRLFKLLLFHVGLGMLANTWRRQTDANRAFWAYLLLGLIFYQFFYYTFRNLKDDMILSLFMMVMAIADGNLGRAVARRDGARFWRWLASWAAVAVLIWIISTIRFYLGLALVCAFALHLVTGSGIRMSYRVLLGGAVTMGFVFLMGSAGGELVQSRGGFGAVIKAVTNVYGLFKVFVTPLPWQHNRPLLAIPHTLYLMMLAPAFFGLFYNFRRNFDWKLFIVLAVAMVVGGYIEDFGPRKRYVMYPVFVSWIIGIGVRRPFQATDPAIDDVDTLLQKYGEAPT